MNTNLDRFSMILPSQLDSEFYFESLLDQAYTKGLISPKELEHLQHSCLALLAEKAQRFNGGDSSSIRLEKAQNMMASNLFTIGVWLKTYPHPEKALAALQKQPVNALYQKGLKRIHTIAAATKTVHTKLLSQLVETPNIFYRSTIEGGIYGFFKLYNPDYSSHEIHITADYPVYNPAPRLLGIEFIHNYVKSLYYENLFCGYFAAQDIHQLLSSYAQGYPKLLINIYEPVLLAALGCILTGSGLHQLKLFPDGLSRLIRLLAGMPKEKIYLLLQNAAQALAQLFLFSNGLFKYIQNSLPLLAGEIYLASNRNTLNRIFIT